MMIINHYLKMRRIISAFLLFMISSGHGQILGNEQKESIPLNWEKDTGSSYWMAEINHFDVPSGEVVEIKGPKNGLVRVTGEKPILIMGTIISPNPIYLDNPFGVVVGPRAIVNEKLNTYDINKNLPETKLNNDNKNEEKKHMERMWKNAYDFVPGPGIQLPPVVEQAEQTVKEPIIISFSMGNQQLNEYIWLGEIRIGGISEGQETNNSQKSQDELIQSEIERVKIQRFTTPAESLGGEGDNFIGMREAEGYGPANTQYIPQRSGSVILVPKAEKY